MPVNMPWSNWSQNIQTTGFEKMAGFWSQTTGLINIYNMSSSNREMELEVIEGVGSYGRQLGWLLEAVDVLIHKLEKSPSLKNLTHEEENALEQVKTLKHRIDSIREKRR